MMLNFKSNYEIPVIIKEFFLNSFKLQFHAPHLLPPGISQVKQVRLVYALEIEIWSSRVQCRPAPVHHPALGKTEHRAALNCIVECGLNWK